MDSGTRHDFRAKSGDTAEERAPAKLNLGLRILGRREDGYHELESLFVPLDLHDSVRVRLGAEEPGAKTGVRVEFSLENVDGTLGAEAPGDDENLAARAARSFLGAAGFCGSVRVELRKRVPVAAGLGGGSSDAAAVFRALQRLFPERVPSGEVRDLALQLGSDVPYFLDPRPALVTGVGQGVHPIAGIPPLTFLLLNPGIPLSTAAVYRAADALGSALTPAEPGSTMRALAGVDGDSEAFSRLFPEILVNDLEPAAVRLCPVIRRLRVLLEDWGAQASGMSGSGATVYGVFRDESSARMALEKVEAETGVWARVARSWENKVSGASPNR